MDSRSISLRTDPNLIADIDAAAAAQDRSRNWWINQAIKSALAEEQAWVAQVERGLKAADTADFASSKDVRDVFDRYKK